MPYHDTDSDWLPPCSSCAPHLALLTVVDCVVDLQADQARYTRYQTIKEEIIKLEAEMQGVDCEKVVKEHIQALNEVRQVSKACR